MAMALNRGADVCRISADTGICLYFQPRTTLHNCGRAAFVAALKQSVDSPVLLSKLRALETGCRSQSR